MIFPNPLALQAELQDGPSAPMGGMSPGRADAVAVPAVPCGHSHSPAAPGSLQSCPGQSLGQPHELPRVTALSQHH